MKTLLKTLLYLFIFLLITCYKAEAQSSFIVDKWKEYLDNLETDETSEVSIEALYDELSYLSEHPFDLNSLKEEDLKRLPFLTDKQIHNLLAHRDKYGEMLSVYELKNVEGLDLYTLELLYPFVHISEQDVEKRLITVENLLKYGRNELYMRYETTFQQKKGYRPVTDSLLNQNPNRNYLGKDFYNSIRYSYSFDDYLQFGLIAEKDGGEPLFDKYRKGYDYYSFHLLINDLKRLKTLIAGDYKMAFGQGLAVSNDYTPSRSAILTQADRRNNGFRRHYSTNESDFFRGVGVTFDLMGFDLSFFYSYRQLDGTADSLLITSLKTDGIHRLQRDQEKRNRVGMQAFGGNLRYSTPSVSVGMTALNYSFGNKRFEPEPQPYNLYYFRGKENTNISVDYLIKRNGIKLYGETALSSNKAMATLNGIQVQPVSYASFLLLYRLYCKDYQAFYGNAFGQNTTVQNEEGVYIGFQVSPFAYWRISAYADFYRFPWLKYGVDAPSAGKEYMVETLHTNGNNTFSLRYRFKQTEKNEKIDNPVRIGETRQHRLRFQFIHSSVCWNFRTALDGVANDAKAVIDKGWMLSQDAAYRPENRKITGSLYAAYFDTDNSSVTVSSFERTPLYAYYKPSFYGQGFRIACSLQYKLNGNVALNLKLASTHYFDREKTGTGLEEIDGSDKTDLSLTLKWNF